MMTAQEAQKLIAGGESRTVEFKSEKGRPCDAEQFGEKMLLI
jgi:hypothetical protein